MIEKNLFICKYSLLNQEDELILIKQLVNPIDKDSY